MLICMVSSDWAFDYPDERGNPLPGGAGWYRLRLPAEMLRGHGHVVFHCGDLAQDTSTGEIMGVDWDGRAHGGFEIIVIQRWMHPDARRVIKAARQYGQVVIGEIDDWMDGLSPSNGAYTATHPRQGIMNRRQARTSGVGTIYPYNINAHREALAACSLITTSTPYLAERYGKLSVPIEVIRNAIDLDRWKFKPPAKKDNLLLGWVGATSHRSGDLEILRGVLGPFMERTGIQFLHAGTNKSAPEAWEVLGIPKAEFKARPQVPINKYPKLLRGIDIGIAPLRNTAFNRAKSAIKAMEYAASGIPFVASQMPEYEWFGQGWLAKQSHDWITGLNRLLDHGCRLELARAARERVATENITSRWKDWEAVYSSAKP